MPERDSNKDHEEETRNEEKSKEEGGLRKPPISDDRQDTIQKQVDVEYLLSFSYTEERRKESLKRLKLYNNQRRDKKKVGDPLLFSVFQTVFSALYTDRLLVKMKGKEEGDAPAAENLTALAENDYVEMAKDELDYDWDWDTGFFGKGYCLFYEFDRKRMVPIPEIMDPMTLIRDPDASSINGNYKGRGRARFWGREIGLTKAELKANPAYFNIDDLKKGKEINSLKDKADEAHREAQGREDVKYKEESITENYRYQLLEWFTLIDGEMHITTWAEGRKTMIRFQPLKNPYDPQKWPVIERSLFPIAHDFDGVSIPDLIEDKQRARAIMINLGMESAQADLYPQYLYDQNRIPNPNNLNFAFNKFIPVKGKGAVGDAVAPIQKSLFHQQVNLILEILNTAAEKSVAAPEVAQGVQPRKQRTLGESELIVAGKSARHSMAARIFGWSERKFWRRWYHLYKEHFLEEIDEKIIRIQGPLADDWRPLTRENLITEADPDIIVESDFIAEAERRRKFLEFSTVAQIVAQDPSTGKRYINRKLARISGVTTQEMKLMFPPTLDEMRSESENRKIDENKLPKIHPLDDDIVHIEVHNKAADTSAKLAHIEAHKFMMMKKRERPDFYPSPLEPQSPGFSPVGVPGEGAGQQVAQQAGTPSPAMTEIGGQTAPEEV